ncbi:MAG: ATP synthase F1 subunit gamma [Planctomycetes bacterium]|nr:ATP synthase F1 subunit gamma [Planctomycetota bacterium]MCP4771627.1 ATP synthase F1 subunit gamma [Planctomycetota bacterium]MCP4860073.1 ATP synthase F1 subunit gamma [Planctomycetota bacterium]
MANIRDLRQRITSVGNIQKITRAMEMVATTKLRRFQGRTVDAKPYGEELENLVQGLSGAVASEPAAAGEAAALFQQGSTDKPLGILVVGSDRGLCGAYNTNVFRKLSEMLENLQGEYVLYVIGRKAQKEALRRELNIKAYLEDFDLESSSFGKAAGIANMLVNDFRKGNLSGVALCATKFRTMVRYEATFDPFLPIAPAVDNEEVSVNAEPILEPSGPQVLGNLIPRYLETRIYHALLEAITSEYASRRFAMKNATDAAGDMKKDLTRLYNRARQAKITQEISEIVSGAEAL